MSAGAAEPMSDAPDPALSDLLELLDLLDLLDLLQQGNARLIERLERVTAHLSALEEQATAAKEAMARVDSRLDRVEREIGIQKPCQAAP
jgi:predicted nuclease with TOPRIM domain